MIYQVDNKYKQWYNTLGGDILYNYIISSDDTLLCNQKIEELQKQFNMEMDINSYDLADDGIYSIIDDLSTISLFDLPKFLIVKSFEEVMNISENALAELLKAMNDVNSNNIIVFITYKSIDSKNTNANKIKKYCTSIDLRIKNMPMPEYVLKRFNDDGYEIESQAVALLCSYVDSFELLGQYIDILESYKLNEKKIIDSDIRLMVSEPIENNVYQLVEAVLKNDKAIIFKYYNDLKLMNIQASYLVSLLITKFQELYNVYILVRAKYQQNDLAELFNVSPGRAYYMIKNAKNTTMQKIKDNLSLLNKLEYDIKSGRIEQSLGLELYFLR